MKYTIQYNPSRSFLNVKVGVRHHLRITLDSARTFATVINWTLERDWGKYEHEFHFSLYFPKEQQ